MLDELVEKEIDNKPIADNPRSFKGRWDVMYDELVEHLKKGKGYPSIYIRDRKLNAIARWALAQVKAKHTLPEDRISRLEEVEGWSWDPFNEQWDRAYESLSKHLEKGEGYPKARSNSQDEMALRRWVNRQRNEYKKERLLDIRIERLEDLPDWSW